MREAHDPVTSATGTGRRPSSGHILLVDEDAEIRGIIALSMGNAGYRVGCAADGEAGWNALCGDRFDLVITGYEMPKLSGLGLLRRMRAGLLHLPVIMIPGFTPWDEEDLDGLLRPGALIEKPFSFGALLAKVEELLNRSFHTSPHNTDQPEKRQRHCA